MSRFLKLMSVLAIVALIAVPAFAEVQNVKVSGDLDSKMINRNDYDFRKAPIGATASKDNDTWFMSAARVQIDADLTDNVSTCVRLLNERDWNAEPATGTATAGNTNIQLDLSYVKLKEMFYAPLTMIIGRQNLRFGSGLVVGAPYTNDGLSSIGATNTASTASTLTAADLSVRRSFDAVRATFDYNPLVIDVLTAKINVGALLGTGNTRDDQDLYGINAAYKFNKYNSEAEAYMFERNAKSVALRTDSTYVFGVRGSLEPISKLVVNGELAMQKGEVALTNTTHMDRSAWAADAGVAYAIDYKWSPKIALNYSYRSGQKTIAGAGITESANQDTSTTAANNTKYKAWDTMFEDQTHGIIANQIFNGNNDGVDSNGHTFNLMASVVPVKDLTFSADYYHFLLANAWDTDQFAGTNPVRTLGSTTYAVRKDKNLGDELDLSLAYDYTEDVKLGLTAGYFLPGKAFLKANNDIASTVMADVKVSF